MEIKACTVLSPNRAISIDSDITKTRVINFYHHAEEVHNVLSSLKTNEIYWSLDFFKLVESLDQFGATPFYAVECIENEPSTLYYFQIQHFNLNTARRLKGNGFVDRIKKFTYSLVDFDCLVCGNLLLTGEYGQLTESGPSTAVFQRMPEVFDKAVRFSKDKFGRRIGTILVKDFFKSTVGSRHLDGFTKFNVQPNMIFEYDPTWNSFDDYLSDLKTKYRTRYNRARKKLGSVTHRELGLEELKRDEDKIYQLYRNVSDNAGFNLFVLDKDYFYKMKETFGQKFVVSGYYLEEELVGFHTLMINPIHLDAHFLGYDQDVNLSHQLYLNMLFDMIQFGSRIGSQKIIMSRTALEIKSSVGAEAVQMECFFKHTNPLINVMTSNLIALFKPKNVWEPRSPFKN